MKEIPLSQGMVTLVDDADYEELSQHKWCAVAGGFTFYARRYVGRIPGKRKTIIMHREILKPRLGYVTDHINGNGLDNQRINLREVTQRQNCMNRKGTKGTSKYKGVSWSRRDKVWRVQIKVDGLSIALGTFRNEEAAAKAYDEAARKHQGEFAYPNFEESQP